MAAGPLTATSCRRPPPCRHLCAPSSWPWAWGWLEPSTPMTPIPAASGRGERGPCCPLRAPSPQLPILPTRAPLPWPPALSPALTSCLFRLCALLPSMAASGSLPISDLVSVSIPARTLLSFLYPSPLVSVGVWLQDRAQSGSHLLCGGQAGGPARGEGGIKDRAGKQGLGQDLARNAATHEWALAPSPCTGRGGRKNCQLWSHRGRRGSDGGVGEGVPGIF